jgi:hypothetical protein
MTQVTIDSCAECQRLRDEHRASIFATHDLRNRGVIIELTQDAEKILKFKNELNTLEQRSAALKELIVNHQNRCHPGA